MAFDFKKEYKEFYMPKNKPEIVTVPQANYIAVRGKGNPNEIDGAYQKAISILYTAAKKAGWSQEELADQMNVTRQSVSKWEGAQSVPDLEKCYAFPNCSE